MWRAATMVGLLLSVGLAAAQGPQMDTSKEAERHYRSGVELLGSEAWEKAAEEFKAAIALDPLMVLAHYNLGQCRMAQKRFVEAVLAYQDCRTAFERLGTLSQKERGDRERARRDEINELKNDLARIRTDSRMIFNVQAQTTYMEDRIRVLESMDYRDADVAKVPGEVYLALGSAYFRQEKLADAEREYREAIKVNAKLGQAHNNLAVICMLTGRLDEAEAEVRLAERNGFRVNPRFKDDLNAARKKQ